MSQPCLHFSTKSLVSRNDKEKLMNQFAGEDGMETLPRQLRIAIA